MSGTYESINSTHITRSVSSLELKRYICTGNNTTNIPLPKTARHRRHPNERPRRLAPQNRHPDVLPAAQPDAGLPLQHLRRALPHLELPDLLHARANLRLQPRRQVLATAQGGQMHQQGPPLPRDPHHQYDHRRPHFALTDQHAGEAAGWEAHQGFVGGHLCLLGLHGCGQRGADLGYDRSLRKPGFHVGVRAQQRRPRSRAEYDGRLRLRHGAAALLQETSPLPAWHGEEWTGSHAWWGWHAQLRWPLGAEEQERVSHEG